jgi:hypothetical protein
VTRKSNSRSDGKSAGKVPKLSPELPEARDEGPRLLPLDGVTRAVTYGSSTELADVALGRRPARRITNQHSKSPRQRKQPHA